MAYKAPPADYVPKPIWEKGKQIPVIGGTGEYQSGKTLFGYSLAPGLNSLGGPRTLSWDFEKSANSYELQGVERIDVPDKMLSLTEKGKTYKPLDVFNYWRKSVLEIPPRLFDVGMVDPISDLESGVCDYVMEHHDDFGYTRKQFENGGGLYWGAVKDFWKSILADLSARFQVFYFTAHLRDKWSGSQRTGDREPKGKDTLRELASLYLWFERLPGTEGKDKGVVPDRPAAKVLKSRLAHTSIDDKGELQAMPMLPPRLPVATRAAINAYILAPPNYAKLKPDEKVQVDQLSEDQKLLLQAQIAENTAIANQTALEKLNRNAELQLQLKQNMPNAPKPTPDMSGAQKVLDDAKRKVDAARQADGPKPEEKPAASESTPLEKDTAKEKLHEKAGPTEQSIKEDASGKLAAEAEAHKAAESAPIDRDKQIVLAARVTAAINAGKMKKEHFIGAVKKETGGLEDPRQLTLKGYNNIMAVIEKLIGPPKN